MNSRLVLIGGFAAAAALRLGYVAMSPGNWDTQSYAEVVRTLDSGGTLYRDTPRYNYSPVWAAVLRGLSRISPVPLDRAVRGLLLLADGAGAWLLFRLARDVLGGSRERAAGAALLFFANPISVFASGFHAQFDGFAIVFLLAALWLAGRRPAQPVAAAAALGASLLVKHVTAFHPLLFARRKEGRRLPLALVFAPYAVFLASFLPYWRERDAVFARVFGYGSLAEDYGTAMVRRLPGVPSWAPAAIFLVTTIASVFVLRRVELARAGLLLFLVMLVFLPGIAEYYFVWPIALGSLYPGAGYAVFTLLVAAFFLGSPDGLGLAIPHLPGWHGVWWGAVFWLAWEVRGLTRKSTA